jgi:flagellar hook-associated protein 1 FlgK
MPNQGSLTLALRSAQSSLSSSSIGIQTTADNISNINTPGYSKKVSIQESYVSANGEGVGVRSKEVVRVTDEKLVENIHAATAEVAHYESQTSYLDSMQQLFGSPHGASAFPKRLSKLSTSIQALSNRVEDPSLHYQAVNAAIDFSTSVNRISDGLQTIRQNVDSDIYDNILLLNQQLTNLSILNQKIIIGKAKDQSVGSLEDARDTVVGNIGDLIGVKTYTQNNGDMSVFMIDGTPLVSQSTYFLSYDSAVLVNPSVSYPNNINGIMLSGKDITTNISTGKLKGLLDLRDKILPNHQAELDSFAKTFTHEINVLHNQGTGFPAQNQLIGRKPVTALDTFSGTGSIRISFLDSAGNFTQLPTDIDLSTIPTVGDLMTAIGSSASINASGTLSIQAPSGQGVSIVSLGTSPAIETTTGLGFSHYFGLNDLFVTAPTTALYPDVGLANNLAVHPNIIQNPGFFSCGSANKSSNINIPPNGTPNQQICLSNRSNDIALAISEKMTQNTVLFQKAGNLNEHTGSFIDYASTIITVVAADVTESSKEFVFNQSVSENLNEKLSSINGVNEEEELSNLILFQQTYKASARLIQTIDELLELTINILR